MKFLMFLPETLGKWLGNRQIRCNWATKGANANDEKQSLDSKSVVELTNGTSGEIFGSEILFGSSLLYIYLFLWFASRLLRSLNSNFHFLFLESSYEVYCNFFMEMVANSLFLKYFNQK